MIFEFFERGQSARLARDGYGIGLHVVRRLVQLLEGSIEVDSAPGRGSCFFVRIPAQLTDEARSEQAQAHEPAAPAFAS